MIFTIPANWRVLVLEDMEQRITWFRQRLLNATFATTAAQAIRALQIKPFQAAFLDHDLGFLDAADHTRPNGNGKEVARYLMQINFSGVIVLHSLNAPARDIMARLLPHAHVAPFGSFDIQRLPKH
jgi:CheY-like chemotaxis protein